MARKARTDDVVVGSGMATAVDCRSCGVAVGAVEVVGVVVLLAGVQVPATPAPVVSVASWSDQACATNCLMSTLATSTSSSSLMSQKLRRLSTPKGRTSTERSGIAMPGCCGSWNLSRTFTTSRWE